MSWRLLPEYQNRKFSDEDVVDMFLNLHRLWFETPENSLYGLRDQMRSILLDSLNGVEVDDDPDAIYVTQKFHGEFLNVIVSRLGLVDEK